VEFVSNLVWTLVALGLFGLWLSGRGVQRGKSLLPGTGVQLVALAMLSAMLLAVISVTDDLEAWQAPAETVRVWSANDRHQGTGHAMHRLSTETTLAACFATAPQWRTVGYLHADQALPGQAGAHNRTPWARPPPSA